jgi:hypothetical protein
MCTLPVVAQSVERRMGLSRSVAVRASLVADQQSVHRIDYEYLRSNHGLGSAQMESDHSYFLRRAEEEHAAGVIADTVAARQAHIEMAFRYRSLASAIEEHELEHLGTRE